MGMRWIRFMLFTKKRKVPASLSNVVVEGATLGFVEPTVIGSVTMVSPGSEYAAVDDKKIYAGNPQFKIAAGAVSAGCKLSNDCIDAFTPAANYTYIDHHALAKPLREDDRKRVIAPGTLVANPFVACTFVATVKILNANQDKVEMA